MITTVKVSMNFTKLSDGNLSPFAGGVIEGMTSHASDFPKPPVPIADLTTLKETFDEAMVEMTDAGPSTTAAKNAARKALIAALRKNALFVEIAANNDLSLLLTSGYEAASNNRAQNPLQQVEVLSVETAQSGELKARVKRQQNARAFEGRIKAAGGEFGPSISFASAKAILFTGLTAGVTYTLQLCALGGSTGKSDWSDPITKMAV
jgi:hypothetical protein